MEYGKGNEVIRYLQGEDRKGAIFGLVMAVFTLECVIQLSVSGLKGRPVPVLDTRNIFNYATTLFGYQINQLYPYNAVYCSDSANASFYQHRNGGDPSISNQWI